MSALKLVKRESEELMEWPLVLVACSHSYTDRSLKTLSLQILTYLHFRILAVVRPPRIIAAFSHAPMLSREHQPVGAVVLHRLTIVALPVFIAVLVVSHHARLRLAWVLDLGC